MLREGGLERAHADGTQARAAQHDEQPAAAVADRIHQRRVLEIDARRDLGCEPTLARSVDPRHQGEVVLFGAQKDERVGIGH